MSSTVAEITSLFARLASHLDASSSSSHHSLLEKEEDDEEDEALQLSISNLNRSFNLHHHDSSRVRVLDMALSLMCFKAPQVFDSMVKHLTDTVVAVLSSSISCRAFRFQNDEVLLIGSSISRRDCADLIEACSDVLGKLDKHGGGGEISTQYKYLLCAVLRVAISSSWYRYPYPSRPILDVKSIDSRTMAVSKFLIDFPGGLSLEDSGIPLRLMSWFLDPITLKRDISDILHPFVERPFLCLSKELHERMDWRAITKCLVLSPVMFIETRALLHSWFLVT
ncbi:hypothetical protein PanWU01x14_223310 [Parasponia andersonii]|uniref:Uncharacterized protein n=1 Tax=Parasponia andersonii TaxID=3476 RepID=A0A2P5BNU2_PARAD|nr:hypothetical protein PanWU01x14_223310 [Parasponia andersonii]